MKDLNEIIKLLEGFNLKVIAEASDSEELKQQIIGYLKGCQLEPLVMPNEVVAGGRCETCEHFTINKYDDGFESEMGNCKCQVKFPDSLFARSAGTRKTMNKKDGRNCPCYESRREA